MNLRRKETTLKLSNGTFYKDSSSGGREINAETRIKNPHCLGRIVKQTSKSFVLICEEKKKVAPQKQVTSESNSDILTTTAGNTFHTSIVQQIFQRVPKLKLASSNIPSQCI